MWSVCRQPSRQVRRRAGLLAGLALSAVAAFTCSCGIAADEPSVEASAQPGAQPSTPTYASQQTVIQGGAIPEGWVPQPIPYQGVGPDGKPITVMIAPTYVFTLPPSPPAAVPAATPPGVTPGPVANANSQTAAKPVTASQAAPRPGPLPSVPYGSNWVYQTQGVQPASTSLAASTPPPPPSAQMAWGGSSLEQPAPSYGPAAVAAGVTAMAAMPPPPPPQQMPLQPAPPAAQPQQYGATLQPPPTQWGTTVAAGTIGTLAVASQQGSAPAGPPTVDVPPSAAAAPQPITAAMGQQPPSPPPAADPDPPLQATPSPSPPSSAGYQWRVVGVVDGDLMTCLDDSGGQHKVRLAEIDAPDLGQDYGTSAREKLADYVFGKTVQVVDQGKDRSGRWIARVYVDGVDINRELVAQGAAWHYAAASSDPSLAPLQEQARSRRLGLWAQPDPLPPWEWRQQQ